MFPIKETIYSQRGNNSFPMWEHSISPVLSYLPLGLSKNVNAPERGVNGLQFFIFVLVDAAEDEVESF